MWLRGGWGGNPGGGFIRTKERKANIRRIIVFAFCSPLCYFASRRFQQVCHARICKQCSKLSGAREARRGAVRGSQAGKELVPAATSDRPGTGGVGCAGTGGSGTACGSRSGARLRAVAGVVL